MSYSIKSDDGSGLYGAVSLTDEEWMELTQHASDGGYSAPHLRMLKVGDDPVAIDEDEARALREALSNALHETLRDAPLVSPEGGRLDRDTVHRVTHVLRRGAVSLSRTPRWMVGD